MKRILLQYQDRIGKEKFDIGKIEGVEYKIQMKPNVQPIHKRYYPLSQEQEYEIEKTVKVLLKHKLIEPCEGQWSVNTLLKIQMVHPERYAITNQSITIHMLIHIRLHQYQI